MSPIYESKLPALPTEWSKESLLHAVSFRFDRSVEATEMEVVSSYAGQTRDLVEFWMPFRCEGQAHMKGHFGYLSVSIPRGIDDALPVRLHVAVPYVDIKDLMKYRFTESREDFDRLMDITQRVLQEMVEAQILPSSERAVSIIPEPLTPSGKLRREYISAMGRSIGCSWLRNSENNAAIFNHYTLWSPSRGRWVK